MPLHVWNWQKKNSTPWKDGFFPLKPLKWLRFLLYQLCQPVSGCLLAFLWSHFAVKDGGIARDKKCPRSIISSYGDEWKFEVCLEASNDGSSEDMVYDSLISTLQRRLKNFGWSEFGSRLVPDATFLLAEAVEEVLGEFVHILIYLYIYTYICILLWFFFSNNCFIYILFVEEDLWRNILYIILLLVKKFQVQLSRGPRECWVRWTSWLNLTIERY